MMTVDRFGPDDPPSSSSSEPSCEPWPYNPGSPESVPLETGLDVELRHELSSPSTTSELKNARATTWGTDVCTGLFFAVVFDLLALVELLVRFVKELMAT